MVANVFFVKIMTINRNRVIYNNRIVFIIMMGPLQILRNGSQFVMLPIRHYQGIQRDCYSQYEDYEPVQSMRVCHCLYYAHMHIYDQYRMQT